MPPLFDLLLSPIIHCTHSYQLYDIIVSCSTLDLNARVGLTEVGLVMFTLWLQIDEVSIIRKYISWYWPARPTYHEVNYPFITSNLERQNPIWSGIYHRKRYIVISSSNWTYHELNYTIITSNWERHHNLVYIIYSATLSPLVGPRRMAWTYCYIWQKSGWGPTACIRS